jgi:hypothetical protein
MRTDDRSGDDDGGAAARRAARPAPAPRSPAAHLDLCTTETRPGAPPVHPRPRMMRARGRPPLRSPRRSL